jgi:inorganic pyrophosphatase
MQSEHGFPAVIEVVVEIPAGSRNKYEFDEVARVIRLDRVLSSAVYYNFDYGFIEGTRADDGDHTDAMLLIDEKTFPGCHVWARPVGVLKMADEKGVDYKVLCVALADPLYAHLEALRQVSPHKLREIEQFFTTYKNLEDKSVEIDGWGGVAETLEILRTDRGRWLSEQAARDGAAGSGDSEAHASKAAAKDPSRA